MTSYTSAYGKKQALPRYFKQKIFNTKQLKLIQYDHYIKQLYAPTPEIKANLSLENYWDIIHESNKNSREHSFAVIDNIRG